MSHFPHVTPTIGTWYNSKSFPESFAVIGYDKDDDDYIEIQYHDGELDRLDPEEWYASNPHEIAEPEDTAPFDVDHDEDMLKLLSQIETQQDLEEHLHHLDSEDSA